MTVRCFFAVYIEMIVTDCNPLNPMEIRIITKGVPFIKALLKLFQIRFFFNVIFAHSTTMRNRWVFCLKRRCFFRQAETLLTYLRGGIEWVGPRCPPACSFPVPLARLDVPVAAVRRGSVNCVVRLLWSTKYRFPELVTRISQPEGRGPRSTLRGASFGTRGSCQDTWPVPVLMK